MLIIEFAALPLAVRTNAAASPPRLIAIGDQTSPFATALDNFFWNNYEPRPVDLWLNGDFPIGETTFPRLPELRLVTRPGGVFCGELRQDWLDFLFTTSADPSDLWRVWATCDTPQVVAISSLETPAYGCAIPPGGLDLLQPEPTDILEPTPPPPYLPVLATDQATLNRWQERPVPFRVRQSLVLLGNPPVPELS